MALIEEVRQMKASGASDQDILQAIQSKGISTQQAYEAISQATIKEAVTSDAPQTQEFQQTDLQPSLMSPQGTDANYQQPVQDYQQYPQEQQYQQDYSSYSPSFSADTISEIAEQVISEKITVIRDSIEKIIDYKTSSEAKLSALDERLQRIEKIIDRLQLSILQKVGESITNIEDLKKELIETQKSFKAVSSSHEK